MHLNLFMNVGIGIHCSLECSYEGLTVVWLLKRPDKFCSTICRQRSVSESWSICPLLPIRPPGSRDNTLSPSLCKCAIYLVYPAKKGSHPLPLNAESFDTKKREHMLVFHTQLICFCLSCVIMFLSAWLLLPFCTRQPTVQHSFLSRWDKASFPALPMFPPYGDYCVGNSILYESATDEHESDTAAALCVLKCGWCPKLCFWFAVLWNDEFAAPLKEIQFPWCLFSCLYVCISLCSTMFQLPEIWNILHFPMLMLCIFFSITNWDWTV